VQAILQAERLRRERQVGLHESSRGCAKGSSAAQRFGQSRELGEDSPRPPGLDDAGRGQQCCGIAAQGAQALGSILRR